VYSYESKGSSLARPDGDKENNLLSFCFVLTTGRVDEKLGSIVLLGFIIIDYLFYLLYKSAAD
jgi:hypothetical protein